MYSRHPAHKVLSKLVTALQDAGMQLKCSAGAYKIKASTHTLDGKLDVVAKVFEADEEEQDSTHERDEHSILHKIQLQRRSGNALQFRKLFDRIEQALLDISCASPLDELTQQQCKVEVAAAAVSSYSGSCRDELLASDGTIFDQHEGISDEIELL